MKNKTNIVYITDDNYVNVTIMSVYSLFSVINKKYNVFILYDFADYNNYDKIKKSCEKFDIKYINASSYVEQYKKIIPEHRHVSVSALLKFFLAEIFTNEDYLLYLDSDIIVRKNLESLFSVEIENNYAAVVKDTIYYVNRKHLEKFDIKNKYYFNSGVMFFNLKKMREDNISEKLISYKLNHDSNFMDQDAFNAVIGGNVYYLSWKYNFLPFYTKRLNLESLSCVFDFNFTNKNLQDIFDESIILHLGGPDKPWKYNQGTLSSICLTYMEKAGLPIPSLQELPTFHYDYPHSPAISVLIPCLNSDSYLQECIESILNQTFQDIEIIFIDAGSTDNTLNIIKKYKENDYRIHVINSKIKSYGHQLNLGIDAAKGEYISILESDDYISNKMFEEQYSIARKYNIDFIKANYQIFYGIPEERKFTYINIDKSKNFYNKVLNARKNLDIFNTNLVIWTGIYRKSFLNKNKIRFNESLGASYQDNGFYFQTYCLAEKIWFMSNDYYRLRRDNPNSSVKNKSKIYAMCDEYKFIEEFVKKRFSHDKNIYRMYLKKKKQNYLWNLTRIAEEFKIEFLNRFGADFKSDLINGDICTPFFSKQEIETVTKIVENSEAYYREYTEIRLENLKKRLISWYLKNTKENLNLDYPKTYNEKIQWIKLYASTNRKTHFSDIITVRNIMKEILGDQYIRNPICIYKNEQYIDFNALPSKFVIQCSHGENYKIIIKDKNKIDEKNIKLKLRGWLSEDYSEINGFELYYKNIIPYIVIDEYNDTNLSSIDYKLWCFDGKTKLIQVTNEREKSTVFYDTEWKYQNLLYDEYSQTLEIPKPSYLKELIELGDKASRSFSHVIVNFKVIENKIYFEKLLFSYMSGILEWKSKEMNIKMGEFIKLPTIYYNIFTKEFYNQNINSKIDILTTNLNLENTKNEEKIVNEQNEQFLLENNKIDYTNKNKINNIKFCVFKFCIFNKEEKSDKICIKEKLNILGFDFIRKERYIDREYIFLCNMPIYYKKIREDTIVKRILFFKIIKNR